jgi:16S rRNA (cytosine1402-N4)-methyltransferase
VEGILLDLGVSSLQLDSPERGFSFQQEGPLDMRMDRRQAFTAADLVNFSEEEVLADIIWRFGEERLSRRIARAIVQARRLEPLQTTRQLAHIVASCLPGPSRHQRIHPATRTFQALRIAVNDELSGLAAILPRLFQCLKAEGRLAVISFHSLEARIVKTEFKKLCGQCVCDAPPEVCRCPREARAALLWRRAVAPAEEEMIANPRARSATLRCLVRLDAPPADLCSPAGHSGFSESREPGDGQAESEQAKMGEKS